MSGSVSIIDARQLATANPHLKDPVYYRKSGLSLNHIVGCPLVCSYCVRHLFGNFDQHAPQALMSDEEACLELDGKSMYGENQEVFYYQFAHVDGFGLLLCRFCFYQNVDVYAAYLPSDFENPYDLEMELMSRGTNTVFILNGKTSDFN